MPTTPPAGLRPPVPGAAPAYTPTAAPAYKPTAAPAPVGSAPVANKLPDAPKFVSPMPNIEVADDAIPAFLPIVAGFAAAASVAFAVLLFLKR